jgi:hypothetical protein
MIVTTREQRRQLDRENAKLPTALQEVPRSQWPSQWPDTKAPQLSVWRSRTFLVQVFSAPAPAIARLSINRTSLDGTRWAEGIEWEELQRLKGECGYGAHDAVEVYPPDRDVVNVANMRHLWVLAEPLAFAWRES